MDNVIELFDVMVQGKQINKKMSRAVLHASSVIGVAENDGQVIVASLGLTYLVAKEGNEKLMDTILAKAFDLPSETVDFLQLDPQSMAAVYGYEDVFRSMPLSSADVEGAQRRLRENGVVVRIRTRTPS